MIGEKQRKERMTTVLNDYRKREITELAEAVVDYYFRTEKIYPERIAKENKITFSYGRYKDAFDGLLQHQFGRFHIFINLDRLNSEDSPRTRFTFGHELGHFYIDEHRNALKKGKTPSHPSFNKLLSKNLAEREADFFASCLLMPSNRFREFCRKKPLDPKILEDLANHFQTSLSSTIFRYYELDLFPMVIIFSKDSKIEWYFKKTDFKYQYLPAYQSPVPETTAAGDFFYKKTTYKDKEIIFANDWFKDSKVDKNEQFYEKCYYQPNNAVLSIIWKKEDLMSLTSLYQ